MDRVTYQSSFGFRFKEVAPHLTCSITYVGQDLSNANYSWKGLTRTDKGGPFLFQYTLSGNAKIRIEQEEYLLQAGTAFFVPFHDDYHYYMPESSNHYECIYISLDGSEAAKCWAHLKEHIGQVLLLPNQSQPIQTLRAISDEAKKKNITDAYKASALAYQFIMDLYRFCGGHTLPDRWPSVIVQAVNLLEKQYHQNLRLDDISAQIGISKYHLIKLFRETTGKTPIQYLTKVRLDKAMELLRNTELSLEEIGQQIGFSNANYFTKVFRKSIGMPPGRFRTQRFPDHIVFD